MSLSSDDHARLESETSVDELDLNNGITRKTPAEARTKPSARILSNQHLKKKPIRANKRSGTGYGGLREI